MRALVAGVLAMCALSAAADPMVGYRWAYTTNAPPELFPPLDRMRLEYSLDGGTSWRMVAYGIPSVRGLNEYDLHLPMVTGPDDDLALLSEDVLIRVQPLANLGITAGDYEVWPHTYTERTMTFAGMVILSPEPGVSVQAGSTQLVQWVQSGAGSIVNIGLSDNAGDNFALIRIEDGCQPGTNSWQWVVSQTPGENFMLCVQSVMDEMVQGISDEFSIIPE